MKRGNQGVGLAGQERQRLELTLQTFLVHRSKNFRTERTKTMRHLSLMAEKYHLVGRNVFEWGRPIVAKVWLTIAFFLR